MKIAIHEPKDEFGGFTAGWVKACNALGVEAKIVNALDTNIIKEVSECDGFMWHWRPSDMQLAKQVIASLEVRGVKTFPNIKTCWHFDDKVGQKYLFEALGIPSPEAWVFYEEEVALEWAKDATYPNVFKLRGGAGAANVKLVQSQGEAIHLIRRMFGKGIRPASGFADLSTKIRKHNKSKDWKRVITQTVPKVLWSMVKRRQVPNERGYVYFQEFIPNNTFDIRVVVVGDRAFAIRRNCRPNDFRASGSGEIIYARASIPEDCLRIAFEAARRLESQCAAFDFVHTAAGRYLIVEVSYGFSPRAYDQCDGYWILEEGWKNEPVLFERWMVEEVVKEITRN